MSEMKQQLSTLMDSEMDMDANQHLLTATSNTQELKQCWREYHLIGDVLRGDAELHLDIKYKVMEQLANEPVAFAPPPQKSRLSIADRGMFGIPSMAFAMANRNMTSMAASVIAVSFVAWMVWQSQAITNPLNPAQINVAQNNVTQNPAPQNMMTAESFDHYLLAHHEYASGNNLQRDVQLTSYPEPVRTDPAH
ncbi:MAG TPA: sigma-E factor negative regulatory protein [Methylophilaceae bacterium]